MSGGKFDYQQYRLEDIADSIERIIANNNKKDELEFCRGFSKETLAKFQETILILRKAASMVQRVDWLVSGDDSEERFHRRWKEEVEG